jgi:peptide/nickel transport system substrate-binding protein
MRSTRGLDDVLVLDFLLLRQVMGGRKMRTKRTAGAVAAAATLVLALAACSGGSSTGGTSSSSGSGTATPAFNAAVSKVYNPSDVKGGTLRMANEGDWDSLDPANNYYSYEWDFGRLYTRTLVTFAAAPGDAGAKLVPDLATSLGVASDNAKTWTYKLKPNLKYEDGTPITSKDVKYDVERSMDKTTFPNGPTYWNDFLVGAATFSPYKDKSPDGLKSIETPDDSTIIFHLSKSFSGMDYFAQLPSTAPVPQAKDTGAKYKQHVISSGPYMFKTNNAGKNFVLVRNPNWSAAADPNRKALPDEIDVALNVNANDIDQRLLAGDLDVAVTGVGVGSAAQGQILGNPQQKQYADAASSTRLWFTSINGNVKPFDNIHCRRAIEYASDRTGYQTAFGGPIAGGDIATNLLPPVIPGQVKFDTYPVSSNTGDVAKAKQELTLCGQPNGFSTSYSYRTERPHEKAAAEALQQSLAKVGIKLTLKGYPQADYFAQYAGKPDFAQKNGLGLEANGWAADWPDGYGFLSQLVDSRVIRATGGSSNFSVRDKAVDALIDSALTQTDITAREKIWVNIDKKVMDDAYILPGVWTKTLFYRPKNLTNVFVNNGYSMYDYTALGVKK